jgi:sortase A
MSASSPPGLGPNDSSLPKRGAQNPVARSGAQTALRILQTFLFVAAATLLVVYAAAQIDAARGRNEALVAFAEARSMHIADVPASASASASSVPTAVLLEYSDNPDQALWDKKRIAAYRDAATTTRDVPLGVLTIPSIELEVPIFDGTSELTLNRGIGRIEGTAFVGAAGNLGLAGHRDGFFRGLKDVDIGDAIDVETLDGTTRYRITELIIVEPTDVYVLSPTDTATLTLVTCYPFYFIGEAPQRYIVKGVAENLTSADLR